MHSQEHTLVPSNVLLSSRRIQDHLNSEHTCSSTSSTELTCGLGASIPGFASAAGLPRQGPREPVGPRRTSTSDVGSFRITFCLVHGWSSKHAKVNECLLSVLSSLQTRAAAMPSGTLSEWLLWARHPGAGDPAGRKPAKEINKVIVYLVTGGAGCSHWGEGRAGRASWEMGSPCQVLKNVEELDRWKGLAGKFRGLGVVGVDGEEPHLPRKAGADLKIASAVQVVPSG